jgi:hypothetical protein
MAAGVDGTALAAASAAQPPAKIHTCTPPLRRVRGSADGEGRRIARPGGGPPLIFRQRALVSIAQAAVCRARRHKLIEYVGLERLAECSLTAGTFLVPAFHGRDFMAPSAFAGKRAYICSSCKCKLALPAPATSRSLPVKLLKASQTR